MCLVFRTLRQMLWLTSGYIALPTDTTYHLTVATRRLVYPKQVLDTNEVFVTSIGFKPRDWRFPLTDYALHDILPDDPEEAVSIRQRSLCFYYDLIIKTLYAAHMTISYSITSLIRKHKKCLKRHTMVYVELTNQIRNSRIDCTDSVIIEQL